MLFGHQNDDTSQPTPAVSDTQNTGANPLALDPATGASLPATQTQTNQLDEPSVLNQPIAPVADDTTTAPVVDSTEPSMPSPPDPGSLVAMPAPPSANPAPIEAPTTPDLPTSDTPTSEPPSNDALLALKQQALTELSPLVGQLDQTPEERFRTTMMMIQSTDNQALIQTAYDAAEQITDEKVRAQALLDIINEINYFTQQKPAS